MPTRKEIAETKVVAKIAEHRSSCALWKKGYCKECSPNLVDFGEDLIKELDLERIGVHDFLVTNLEQINKQFIRESTKRAELSQSANVPSPGPEIGDKTK